MLLCKLKWFSNESQSNCGCIAVLLLCKLKWFSNGNGISINGVIGYFLDVPVVLSDILYDTTSHEGFILMMKKNALSLLPKESPFTEVARDASKRLSTIFTSDFYAMALTDDTAVVYAKNVIG